jgi:hypothetical protein
MYRSWNFVRHASLAALILTHAHLPAAAEPAQPSIIDTHVHLLPGKELDFTKAVENAIEIMDSYGIATSIVMSPPRPRNSAQNYDYADFREALKKHPGRFLYLGGGGTLNLILHANADSAEIDADTRTGFVEAANQIAADMAIGFGEMSSLHISLADKHGYSFVPADHPLLKALADVAAKRRLPIDLHMDAVAKPMKPPVHLAGLPNNPDTFPETLSALDRLLGHNPKATIIWAHGGTDHLGDFDPRSISALMDKHDNLFVSLKVVGPKAGTHNRLFKRSAVMPEWLSLFRRHPDRFVIGTDSFYVDPNARGPGMQFAATSKNRLRATQAFLRLLPSDLARKLARENAISLYRLSPEQAPDISGLGNSKNLGRPKKQKRQGLCKDGNLAHCKVACSKGVKKACARLRRGN